METADLQKIASQIVKKIDKKHKVKRDGQFTICKLVDELGELAELVNYERLRHKKPARKNLEDEFADVSIQLMELADSNNIDLEKAIQKKIRILKNRHKIK
jgi:NTP pyrophosphatase (non-canonical NTP hydrolase)